MEKMRCPDRPHPSIIHRNTTPSPKWQRKPSNLGRTLFLSSSRGKLGHRCGCWCLRAVAEQLSIASPCKINLFLRVMGRRSDGFHDLASLFHVIDLSDSMDFSPLASGETKDRLECDMCGVPTDESNLVIKALNLFREKSGSHQFFNVKLHKVVPHGAGLGGGSANAATALWAANELCGRPASESDLLSWSADIGSDISVFFSKGAAYCTGRGEIVRNVPPPLPLDTPLLLVKPAVGLPTGQIFKQLDLDKRSSADPEALLNRLSNDGMSQDVCVNDLEPPAFKTLPELADLKGRLQREGGGKFSAVFMTGSGSTIVCAGSDEVPEFLQEEAYSDVFVSPARLIMREEGTWY
eukprot:evm.model.scf_310.5 EVM.evm.TU.scf_310.5   scf_310:25857-26912(+)